MTIPKEHTMPELAERLLNEGRELICDAQEFDQIGLALRCHDKLVAALSASMGYLLNAKIDLETGATKKTAIRTIDGGLKMVREALDFVRESGR